MTLKFRTAAAVVLASMFLFSCPVMAAGGGGGTNEEDDSNAMTYITIGLVVLVGGLFVVDIITSSDEETVPVDISAVGIVDTGVNWDALPSNVNLITVGVSVFPGESGSNIAMEFINVLNELAGDNITVYDDPLDLGMDSADRRATIASEYFGVDYLIFQVDNPDSLQYGIASSDSVLWTSSGQSDNNILLIVEEFLRLIVSDKTAPELN